jgi:hypothetical protein
VNSAGTAIGSIGVRTKTPTAWLQIAAGANTTASAPLKFTTGPLLLTPEAGAVEFLTDKWYGTITTGAARKEFTLNDAALTSGRVPYVTTNGRLKDITGFTFSGANLAVPGNMTAVVYHGAIDWINVPISVTLNGTVACTRLNNLVTGYAYTCQTCVDSLVGTQIACGTVASVMENCACKVI